MSQHMLSDPNSLQKTWDDLFFGLFCPVFDVSAQVQCLFAHSPGVNLEALLMQLKHYKSQLHLNCTEDAWSRGIGEARD